MHFEKAKERGKEMKRYTKKTPNEHLNDIQSDRKLFAPIRSNKIVLVIGSANASFYYLFFSKPPPPPSKGHQLKTQQKKIKPNAIY